MFNFVIKILQVFGQVFIQFRLLGVKFPEMFSSFMTSNPAVLAYGYTMFHNSLNDMRSSVLLILIFYIVIFHFDDMFRRKNVPGKDK